MTDNHSNNNQPSKENTAMTNNLNVPMLGAILDAAGTVSVDTGRLLIIDPAYLTNELVDEVQERLMRNAPILPVGRPGLPDSNLGVLVGTGFGDGTYPVDVVTLDDGRVASVTVHFVDTSAGTTPRVGDDVLEDALEVLLSSKGTEVGPHQYGVRRVTGLPIPHLRYFIDNDLLHIHADDGVNEPGAAMILDTLKQLVARDHLPMDGEYIHDGDLGYGLLFGDTVSGYFTGNDRDVPGLWIDSVDLAFDTIPAAVRWFSPIVQAPFRFDDISFRPVYADDALGDLDQAIYVMHAWWD